MRVVAARVRSAAVVVDGHLVSAIGQGMLALVGFARTDTPVLSAWMADRLARLRIFPASPASSGDQDLQVFGGQVLAVSQFTLYGATDRGRRPDFSLAMPRDAAAELFRQFVRDLERTGLAVQQGCFGQEMEVSSVNWGPYTIILEREAD